MTVREAKKYIADELEHICESATFEATEILISATGISRSVLLFSGKETLTPAQLKKINKLLHKRKKGVPLQYLLGQWEFYSITLKVGKGVLIPRADTEILVDAALDHLSGAEGQQRVFDFCSGSGAIGIAVAKNRPKDIVTLVEKSKKAFKYLKRNVADNKVQCSAVLADVLSWKPSFKCDLLLCNPPYIRTGEISTLSKEVKKEPKMALDGGTDGLDFYRAITKRADELIKPGGRIMYEIGFDEANEVKEILSQNGFKNIQILKDYGGNDRVVTGDFLPMQN